MTRKRRRERRRSVVHQHPHIRFRIGHAEIDGPIARAQRKPALRDSRWSYGQHLMSSLGLAIEQVYPAILIEQQPSAVTEPHGLDAGFVELCVSASRHVVNNNPGKHAVRALQKARQLSAVRRPGPRVKNFVVWLPAWKIRRRRLPGRQLSD